MDVRTNEFVCQICQIPFNENENLPKILPCGHTICKECIANILKVTKLCPICRRSIDDSEQATNYSLLNLCDSFCKTPTNIKDDIAHIYIKKITNSLDKVQKDLLCAIKDNESLTSLRSQNDLFVHQMEDVRISFNEIKLSVEALRKSIFFTDKGPDVNINIKNYTTCEIAERLQKGEKMYAVAIINDEMKYGKVYCRGPWIFINALTLTEIEKNSSIFWMYDFKNQFNEFLCPFFTFSRNLEGSFIKVIRIVERSNYSEILELCTGESGTTFKDNFYSWKGKMLSVHVNANKYASFCFEKNIFKFYERTPTNLEVMLALNWEFTNNKDGIIDSNTVGNFFKDLKFPFLFPKKWNTLIIKESGIAVSTSSI